MAVEYSSGAMDDYARWRQEVEQTLHSSEGEIRLPDVDPQFLEAQFRAGTPPQELARTPNLPPRVVPQAVEAQPPLRYDCPHCRLMDQAKRVEALMMSDSRFFRGAAHGHSIEGQSISQLGTILAPPKVRSTNVDVGIIGFGCLALAAGLCVAGAFASPPLWIGAGIFALLGIIPLIFAIREGQKRAAFVRDEMPHRYYAWQHLMYCERCGIVFDSRTHTACPAAEARYTFGKILGPQSYR